MSSDQSSSSSLGRYYRRLFTVTEEDLRAEARGFIEWLFDDALIRPCTIELLRRDRADAEHFIEHQCGLFIRVASLLQRFLSVYPHEMVDGAFVCDNGVCQAHLRMLDELLRNPKAVDGDWLAGGATPDQTPLSLTIHHLCVFEQQHADFMGNFTTDQLKLELNDLSVQHRVAFRHRADRLKVSSARALRELIRWTGVREQADDFGMPAETIWTHLRRVHLDLQSIISMAQDLDSILGAFRARSQGNDANRLRQLASPGPLLDAGENRLAAEIVRYLQDHGVRALPRERVGQLSTPQDHGTVLVDAMVYSELTPEPAIRAAVQRLRSVVQPLAAKGHTCQAIFALFRLGGPVCEVPARLDFNHFAIRLEHVDLGDVVGDDESRSMVSLEMASGVLTNEVDPTPTSRTPRSMREPARATRGVRRCHAVSLFPGESSGLTAPLGWTDTVWAPPKAAKTRRDPPSTRGL